MILLIQIIQTIQKYWLLLTLTLLAIIATLSLWPVAHLPDVPGTDKAHHFIAYAALMLPLALKQSKHYSILVVGFITFIMFSGAIELIQPYVNRYGEWLDMAANAIGLFCGWLLARVLLYFCQIKT
ncbi:MAG: VanZ family protein [Colwellia sp.]|nr:VanZ family protein [Colwellia sp.]